MSRAREDCALCRGLERACFRHRRNDETTSENEVYTHEVELESYEVMAERKELEAERNSPPIRALHDNPVMTVLVEGSIKGRRLG